MLRQYAQHIGIGIVARPITGPSGMRLLIGAEPDFVDLLRQ